ncbi:MAG TPA: hypothetical protein V6D23_27030 [Candidatus Obscuribacterales bacterium]
MTQSFRSPPRQIGFKPATPRLTPSPVGSSGTAAKIRQQALQLQQLQSKLRIQEERLTQLKIPSSRQSLEAQLQQLRKEVHTQQQSLQQLRGLERIEMLKPHIDAQGEPAELLRRQLAEIEAIYRVHQPLPASLLPTLDGLLQALRALLDQQLKGLRSSAAEGERVRTRLAALGRELWETEYQQLVRWWDAWQPQLVEAAPESVTFESVKPAEPAADDFQILTFQEQGPLELSFDVSNRKSVVRNQMGITLNQPKKNYQEYLEAGFSAIDQTVGSRFEDRQPLYGAVESFLEAISLDRSRYEAYFGLGYLYSLVKDLNHALYFLDLAFRISGDPAIQEMMDRVRSACNQQLTVNR